MDEFLRACQSAVLDNEAKVLAGQMGVPHVSLLQRANPDNDAHHLTIEHLFGILLHTRDMRPLAALADQFGFDLVNKEAPTPKALTASMMNVGKEIADLTLAVHSALADGRVTQIEKQAIRKEIDHVRHELCVMEESVKVA
ncbi:MULTISPECIES: phage regulatory CII family protein [Pseudomonas]|uniref:phage regulatory CII family protein n=1 Tax=Pseudomonas TaxID=286 RepID=UPI00215BFBC4|nr:MULTISPECIES: phage regulatory CII family protein [unclassified Pseudomonas]MCR8931115.1 Rha family transcriptional regulator [Pseudomonas sp. S11A4]MCR8974723.1 Rha family transcriptional regulator [Pseudomonas sp. S11P7]